MIFKKPFFILCLNLLLLFFINQSECAGIGDKLKNILLDFQKRMCNPIPSLGLPVLDPFEDDKIEFNVTEERFGHLEGILWRFKFSNLSNFELHKVDFTSLTLKFDFDISIPQIELKTAYKAKGIISDLFPIDGSGLMVIRAYDPRIVVKGRIKVNPDTKTIYLGDLKITPKVSGLSGTVDNFTPSAEMNELFDNILNQNGSEIVDTFWSDYEIKITQGIENISKEFLKDLTLKKLLEIIKNDKPIFSESDPPPTCKD